METRGARPVVDEDQAVLRRRSSLTRRSMQMAGVGHGAIPSTTFHSQIEVMGECTDTRERCDAARRIAKVANPRTDPVRGRSGPLLEAWRKQRADA